MRCDTCRKLRLVHRDCLPSLSASDFNRATPVDSDAIDWLQWLEEAPRRHAVFSAKHAAIRRSGEADDVLRESVWFEDEDVHSRGTADEEEREADAYTLSVGTSDVGSEDDLVLRTS